MATICTLLSMIQAIVDPEFFGTTTEKLRVILILPNVNTQITLLRWHDNFEANTKLIVARPLTRDN